LKRGDAPHGLEGDFVAISMADTGTGISRDVLAKVFEPFFTTKSVGKGTGLGLSQVYGFAQQSRGAALIDSEVGRGTTVTIYLPRSSKPLQQDPPPEGPKPPTGAVGTILLVEDNPEVADITATLLAQLGHHVVPIASAADALARIEDGAIDLVFSDIVMPGPMDGIALAREIRARHPHIPVLLATGYSELAQDIDREFAILRKPYAIAALEGAVRDALRRRARDAAAPAATAPQRASSTTASTS
jgi:CheY-like chemotaxis protein